MGRPGESFLQRNNVSPSSDIYELRIGQRLFYAPVARPYRLTKASLRGQELNRVPLLSCLN